MLRPAIVLLVVLVVLFGAGKWLSAHRHADKQHDVARVTTPQNSDYFMKNATLYAFDKDGSLDYRAHSVLALHFPDGSAHLDNVNVHYVENTPTYWDMHAAQGQIPANDKHSIFLYGGVNGHHPRADGQMIHFVTRHAWVHPKQHLVTSDAPAKAYEPGETITGVGMRVNLRTNTLNLLKNVHVTYAP